MNEHTAVHRHSDNTTDNNDSDSIRDARKKLKKKQLANSESGILVDREAFVLTTGEPWTSFPSNVVDLVE